MNQRERVLAIVLLVVIFIGGGGLVGYLFYYRSVSSAKLRLQKIQTDVDANDKKVRDLETAAPRLLQMKHMSLPADVNLAQREYEAELGKLLRQADFAGEAFTIHAKPIEKRETVAVAKRLPYLRLYFDIEAKGELLSVVNFLDAFYRLPLLHRIKNISIVRQQTPVSAGGAGAPAAPGIPGIPGMPGGRGRGEGSRSNNNLVFSATVEALVLDGAEKRTTLLPKDVKSPERLARKKDQYVSIAGRNVFFGPPPVISTAERPPVEKKSEVDVSEFVVVDEITHDPVKGVQASLYDAFNNYKYFVKQLGDGSFIIRTFYYIKDAKKNLNLGEELEIQGDNGETQLAFKVIRIDATNLLLRDSDTGKYYRAHIGRPLKDAQALATSEAKALGLEVEEEKKPEVKKDEKKEEKKKGSSDVKKAPAPKPVVDEGK